MKNKVLKVISIVLFSQSYGWSQNGECTTQTGYNCVNQYPTGNLNATTSYTPVAEDNWAGEYFFCNVQTGLTYVWSLCSNIGAICSYDSQLTLQDQSGSLLCMSDNYCGDDASIEWTATYSGFVKVNLTESDGLDNTIDTRIMWGRLTSASIDESTEVSDYNIFPTTVNDYLTIHSKSSVDSELQVYNMNGSLAFTGNINGSDTKVDLSILNSGIYLVKIPNANGSIFTTRIQKI